ncbi:two-component sensor histidine kinase [Actinocatenispora comari]|uniref:histidine kinase n=2 Tax=Actinocatenispora comari TaxID=2807577 RepID=A0A8J4END4_9ACTN|nr:two-component sensor histidine kinase [Actinocatenispora comari]
MPEDVPAGTLGYRSGMSPTRAGGRRGQEAVLVVAVAAVATLAALIAPPGRTGLDPLGYALPVVAAVSLLARARYPRSVVVLTTVCIAVYFDFDYPGYGIALPLLVALFSAVRAGGRWIALVPLAALASSAVLWVLAGQSVRQASQTAFLLLGWIVAATAMGAARRQFAANVRQLEERAADAERTREETAHRRAVEERLRIARELHDSLTHSISVIAMQAGVAVHLANKRGEPVPEALTAIQDAGRDANRELRATLGALRTDAGEPGNGVDALPDLVGRTVAAGLPVTLHRDATAGRVPTAVDRAAYRIVQEALTNTGRHARATAATVAIRRLPDSLVVEVSDDGCATPDAPPRPGIGLLGMRERVTALGGTLSAAPHPDGGFLVHAELPLQEQA